MSQETTQSCTSYTTKVPHALKEIQEKRDEEIAKMSAEVIHQGLDVENVPAAPLFDRFYSKGETKTLLQMTNITYHEMNFCGIVAVVYSAKSLLLDEVKNRCYTKRNSLYCHVCCESCNN